MDRPQTIQIPAGPPPDVDWQTASATIQPMPGCAFVEMFPPGESHGEIELPSRVAGRLRPDAGVVLAAAPDVPDVEPGDAVLVMPYRGNWFEGFTCGGFRAHGQVRVYGTASPNERLQVKEHATVGIRATVGRDFPKAVGPWVFIRRDPLETSKGGLLLTDDEQFRSGKATVVSAGSQAYGPDGISLLQSGQRVMYHGNAVVTDCEFLSRRYSLPGHPKDYVFIKASDLYAVWDEEVPDEEV